MKELKATLVVTILHRLKNSQSFGWQGRKKKIGKKSEGLLAKRWSSSY